MNNVFLENKRKIRTKVKEWIAVDMIYVFYTFGILGKSVTLSTMLGP